MSKYNPSIPRPDNTVNYEMKIFLSKVYAISKNNGGYSGLDEIIESYLCPEVDERIINITVRRAISLAMKEEYITKKGKTVYRLTEEGLNFIRPLNGLACEPAPQKKWARQRMCRSDKLTRIANGTRNPRD